MCSRIYFSRFCVPTLLSILFLFSFLFLHTHIIYVSFFVLGYIHINKEHQLKLRKWQHSKYSLYKTNEEESALAPGREELSFAAKTFPATAFEILLKSSSGLCWGCFGRGGNFFGLPADKVKSASASTLAATLTSLWAFVNSAWIFARPWKPRLDQGPYEGCNALSPTSPRS